MNIALFGNHGTVEGKKDRLVRDLKGVVADTDDLLQQVADSSAEEFIAARVKIEGRLRDARSRLDDARTSVTREVCAAADLTQAYVIENPWKVLGVAAAAGLVTAILLSRR